MATPNPLENSQNNDETPSISSKTYTIAGIQTTVYGLDELNPTSKHVAVLWLLHPRLQIHTIMAPTAASAIADWNARPESQKKGLIAVSFDQRNHGTRQVNPVANESWKKDNPTHAPDMFSIYHGTAQDTSLLMDYLAAYTFPDSSHTIITHLALGVSLGGHSTWVCLLNEPRISAGVVVIGCPDYKALMLQRAEKSKLSTFSADSKSSFYGSKHFPEGLYTAVQKYDPAGLLMSDRDGYLLSPSDQDKERLRPLLKSTLGGKRILCLSGGKDKLVPYACSTKFLDWLKQGLDKESGWFNKQGTVLEDIVDKDAGHEYSAKMKVEAIRFISETLAGDASLKVGTKTSKI